MWVRSDLKNTFRYRRKSLNQSYSEHNVPCYGHICQAWLNVVQFQYVAHTRFPTCGTLYSSDSEFSYDICFGFLEWTLKGENTPTRAEPSTVASETPLSYCFPKILSGLLKLMFFSIRKLVGWLFFNCLRFLIKYSNYFPLSPSMLILKPPPPFWQIALKLCLSLQSTWLYWFGLPCCT